MSSQVCARLERPGYILSCSVNLQSLYDCFALWLHSRFSTLVPPAGCDEKCFKGGLPRRRALLKKTLDEGFEDSSKARRPRGTEAVRPGRLLTCLTGMQRELAAQGNAANQPILNR